VGIERGGLPIHSVRAVELKRDPCHQVGELLQVVEVKCDHETGVERTHRLPEGDAVSEPIFVPRSADAAEDDGWLLAVAYDPGAHRSRLIVLDATDPEREPLFAGHLRHHVPQSFHGTFTDRVARPDA
jgi:all-trans-8'-apo-beta-carotenal 15,15'-oxygenase